MGEVFNELNAVNVNGHTEIKKNGTSELTYLSWPYAWAEVKKRYPGAHYEIEKFNGLPYVFDPETGYIVYTTVTIDGVTHEMWLPVMDGANKAMKNKPYKYTTGYGQYMKEKTCEAATMFDINKTIMRCLVKNLAMFGLGLYIYAGEDLPEEEADATPEQKPAQTAQNARRAAEKPQAVNNSPQAAKPQETPQNAPQAEKLGISQQDAWKLAQDLTDAGVNLEKLLANYKIPDLRYLTPEQVAKIRRQLEEKKREEA